MRTMPLWGLRSRAIFLHDGRATDLPTAISLHDGQGKAAAAAFAAMSAAQQQALLSFLGTLKRRTDGGGPAMDGGRAVVCGVISHAHAGFVDERAARFIECSQEEASA
jgi:Di-haem oxidoreductase, putative peroxidase